MSDIPVIIKGTKVALTPQQRENVPTYWKWICDLEVNARLTSRIQCWIPACAEKHPSYWKEMLGGLGQKGLGGTADA
jgi:hypothetical protein